MDGLLFWVIILCIFIGASKRSSRTRRRSSGLFESIAKSLFSTGTTVHRKKDWLGRKVTVVKHHDSGKTKTYTHGTGFFGNTTKTETTQNGQVIEQGKLKKTFFLGTPVEKARRKNGDQVTRTYDRGWIGKRMDTSITHADGSKGSGSTSAGLFSGTKTHYTKTQTCHRCHSDVTSSDGYFQCSCGHRWGRGVQRRKRP